MARVRPQCWPVVGGPRDKIWDIVPVEWPIRSRIFTTSLALVMCWNFLGGPNFGFKRHRSLPKHLLNGCLYQYPFVSFYTWPLQFRKVCYTRCGMLIKYRPGKCLKINSKYHRKMDTYVLKLRNGALCISL